MMDRRAFISTVGGCILAAPLVAETQQAGKVYRIGLVAAAQPVSEMAGSEPVSSSWRALVQGLRALGYMEGAIWQSDHPEQAQCKEQNSYNDIDDERAGTALASTCGRPRREPPATPGSVIVASLTDPQAYPYPVGRIDLIETHISWVFLAGDRVYKVKKPVDLGFLDFTTLERRRFFCEEEVRLNQRLTHDVYFGVVELNGRERVRVGGPGPTREVAVEMRRLPHDRMIDVLVRAGRADPALLEDIGRAVARFHAVAATGGEIDALGGLETIRANWEENFEQTATFSADVLPHEWRSDVQRWVRAFTEREAGRFAERVRAGRSRDCHGDLQAQHVCCTDPIQIFDCIEFNHRFRYGDVAGEVAFLMMDLDRLGRADLGVRFLNAYLEESGDYDAVPLLDFYCAYRAYVRGKVLGFMNSTRLDVAAKARARFGLAVRYTQENRAPRLVITTGVVGSGKSTVGRAVAAGLGAVIVRTDAVRKRLSALSPTARRTAGFDQGLYTVEIGRQTYSEASRLAGVVLK